MTQRHVYMGTFGSLSENDFNTITNDAFDDIDYSALTDYLDITEADAKDIVDTIKNSVKQVKNLNDLDLTDIGSLENADSRAQAVSAYGSAAVDAYDNKLVYIFCFVISKARFLKWCKCGVNQDELHGFILIYRRYIVCFYKFLTECAILRIINLIYYTNCKKSYICYKLFTSRGQKREREAYHERLRSH